MNNNQLKLIFPDGSEKEFNFGVTPSEVAASISSSLVKKCVIAEVDGELVDMNSPLSKGESIKLLTASAEGLEPVLNHSCAHLLANAIKELYPGAMFGVGPAIEEGFYYDMDLGDVKLTEEDLPKIEKKMQALVASGMEIKRREVSKEEALELFSNDVYKTELINELPDGEIISIYVYTAYGRCRFSHK